MNPLTLDARDAQALLDAMTGVVNAKSPLARMRRVAPSVAERLADEHEEDETLERAVRSYAGHVAGRCKNLLDVLDAKAAALVDDPEPPAP